MKSIPAQQNSSTDNYKLIYLYQVSHVRKEIDTNHQLAAPAISLTIVTS